MLNNIRSGVIVLTKYLYERLSAIDRLKYAGRSNIKEFPCIGAIYSSDAIIF